MKNNRKNLKINSGGGYPKWSIYLNILKRISEKGVEIKSTPVIIHSKALTDAYFIVDKKYEKLCQMQMKKYDSFLKGKSAIYKVKYISILAVLITISLLYNKEEIEKNFSQYTRIEESMETEPIFLKEEAKRTKVIETFMKDISRTFEIQKEFLNEIIIQQAAYDTYLKEYSNYYHLDSEKIIELAKLTTNNYQDFSSIIGNPKYDYTNPEACCMLFVYHLYHNRPVPKLSISNFKIINATN